MHVEPQPISCTNAFRWRSAYSKTVQRRIRRVAMTPAKKVAEGEDENFNRVLCSSGFRLPMSGSVAACPLQVFLAEQSSEAVTPSNQTQTCSKLAPHEKTLLPRSRRGCRTKARQQAAPWPCHQPRRCVEYRNFSLNKHHEPRAWPDS